MLQVWKHFDASFCWRLLLPFPKHHKFEHLLFWPLKSSTFWTNARKKSGTSFCVPKGSSGYMLSTRLFVEDWSVQICKWHSLHLLAVGNEVYRKPPRGWSRCPTDYLTRKFDTQYEYSSVVWCVFLLITCGVSMRWMIAMATHHRSNINRP